VSTGGPPDALAAAAIDVLAARAGTALTRFDGNLGSATDLPDPGSVLLSATRLESYAVCPHAYFVERLLGVQPVEQPEQTIVISALDIGSLMHEAMDVFVTGEHDRLPGYGRPWTDEQRERLLTIGAAEGGRVRNTWPDRPSAALGGRAHPDPGRPGHHARRRQPVAGVAGRPGGGQRAVVRPW
jgi:hypothetical protein